MTMWCPDLTERSGPRYLAIADALGEDIRGGELRTGERLPTHRELARCLEVTVGTVSRAYAEAERRGLVRGEVGRGTFVQPSGSELHAMGWADLRGEASDLIDMGPSVPGSPLDETEDRVLRQAFESLARSPALASLLGCQPHPGAPRHRAAAAAWLRGLGYAAAAENVLVCSGGQHAMAVAFATLTHPGDVVMTEALTFPGMKGLANLMHLRLRGLEIDGEGLCPDVFEAACRSGDSKVLYIIPTHHNPTTAVMSEGRRLEIIDIARRHDVTIVEDDIYGFLPESPPPPFSALAPEISYTVHSASKVTVPGLRIGFLVAPEPMVERLAAGIWATTWMASGPMAEIVARWIEDGTIHRFRDWRRDEAARRNQLAARLLAGDLRFRSNPHGYYLWLQLPEPWRSADFVEQARRRGVSVTGAEAYAAGRGTAPHAVRISLASEADRGRVEEGLRILAAILAERPEPCVACA